MSGILLFFFNCDNITENKVHMHLFVYLDRIYMDI